MTGLKIYRYWPRPLVEPICQGSRLELQDQDSRRSGKCPVYVEACKRGVYLCTSGDIHIHWHGDVGHDLSYPDWWDEEWKAQRRSWAMRCEGPENEGIEYSASRFIMSRPLGGAPATHAGGFVMNWFTGLSIQTDPGWKVLVTRPANQYSHQWTVQDGIYDTDLFPGDFSFNLQILTQEPIFIPLGMPVASLWVIPDTDERPTLWDAPVKRAEAADTFYRHKSAGLKYQASLKQPGVCPFAHSRSKSAEAGGS